MIEVKKIISEAKEELIELIKQLCLIPSPSHHEEKKAEFIKNYLIKNDAENVYIDEVNNVIYPIITNKNDDFILFCAHTDTVFNDIESISFKQDDKYLYYPGVGDDTTCLAMLLIVAKYICKYKLRPKCNILIVANSCEEGLGNLKGIKKIMETYKIKEVYSLDAQYDCLINKCVGSHRYEITINTEGGHSFRDFGNKNAIYIISNLVNRLYECQVPIIGSSSTTYNVGNIYGGTSINTIAQNATILYEYRSDNSTCLQIMKNYFMEKINDIKQEFNIDITIKEIGIRPCMNNVDLNKLNQMTNKVISICQKHSNMNCIPESGSTDCNIPMSMGIPAIAVGTYLGHGEHTKEEKVLIDSLPVGLSIISELILEYFRKN